MTGMWNFNLKRVSALWLGLTAVSLAADVSLTDGNKLTGEFQGMDESGTVTLVSPLSSEPLLLNGKSVLGVDFGVEETSPAALPDQRIELVNGDVLPMEAVALDGKTLTVASADLGTLKIPKTAVDSIQLGVVPERVAFANKPSFDGWSRGATKGRNWRLDGKGFQVDGSGSLSRKVDLPEKFIMRFDLNWKNNPRFWVFFADPLEPKNKKVNRYRLEISQANVSLKRESSDDIKFTQIAIIPRSDLRFEGDSVSIEIRMDRSRGLIHLYVNGELEGRYTDPVPNIPDSSGITFGSGAPRGDFQTISNFKILEWDDRGDRHRAEKRGEGKSDALIGRFGERFGGKLTMIQKSQDGSVFTFKSDFQEKPIELPAEEVSVVFLAQDGRVPDPVDDEALVLRLKGEGSIQVSSCVFTDELVKVTHPLLGEMELNRESVIALEKRQRPEPKSRRPR